MNASYLHIDHYRKKGMNWPHDVSFDWNNLVVESRNQEYGACYKDNLTRDVSDYNKLLNPMVDYPEEMITYLPSGEMVARDGLNETNIDKVIFTIGRFNLNHQLLKSERETLIGYIIKDYTALSDDEIRSALEDNGYPTVVEYALDARRAIEQTV